MYYLDHSLFTRDLFKAQTIIESSILPNRKREFTDMVPLNSRDVGFDLAQGSHQVISTGTTTTDVGHPVAEVSSSKVSP